MYLVRNASSRSFLKSKFWNSSFFSHFTKFSSLSYWFLAWSVTSHEILFSKKKIVSLRFETDAALFRLSDHVYSNQPQSVSDKTKFFLSEIREPDPTPHAYTDPWTTFFFHQRSVLFLKDLWWLPQRPLTHPLNGVLF